MKTLAKHINEAINIPKNDYKAPTEVREEVVQAICNAFIAGREYEPNRSCYEDRYIFPDLNGFGHTENESSPYMGKDGKLYERKFKGIKFNGAEMKAAFKELINAGYHMMVCRYPRRNYTQLTYACSKKPHKHGYEEVTDFTYDID